MPEAIKIGDQVTVLRHGFGTVERVGGINIVIRLTDRTSVGRSLPREGVSWIRGHHGPDSDEAKALLAAWSLQQ